MGISCKYRRLYCALFGVATLLFATGAARAAATDFSQTSIALNVGFFGLEGVLLRAMRDPNPASQDSMYFFQPVAGDDFFIPGVMTRRNAAIDTLTQTQVALLDFGDFSPSGWFPAWTFGSSMGVFRSQTRDQASYAFDVMPLSDYNSPYGQLLLALDFDPASPPVEFSAGPGGPLENFEIGFGEVIIPRFTASAPFPTMDDSPAFMLTGFLQDDVNPAVAVTFGARTDSGAVAAIPVETFPGLTSSVNPSISSILLGDFDGDGNTDRALLVETGDSDLQRQLVLSKGNGDGSFQAPIVKALQPNTFLLDMAAVDFDGDGAQDLVLSYLSSDISIDPPAPGAIEAVADPLGAFNVRTIALPSVEQRPTWVEAMDCDQDDDRDDLVIVTNRFPEGFEEFAIRASDVVCYLNGDSGSSVVLYPEASLNLAADAQGVPYSSFVVNSAVGTLGCGDAWAGTAAFLVTSEGDLNSDIKLGSNGEPATISINTVFAQHSDCGGDNGGGGGGGGGGGQLIQGAGCSLSPAGAAGWSWGWMLLLPLALPLRRRK